MRRVHNVGLHVAVRLSMHVPFEDISDVFGNKSARAEISRKNKQAEGVAAKGPRPQIKIMNYEAVLFKIKFINIY